MIIHVVQWKYLLHKVQWNIYFYHLLSCWGHFVLQQWPKYLAAVTTLKWDQNCATYGLRRIYRMNIVSNVPYRDKVFFGCQEELYLRCIMTQRDVRSSARLHSKAHYLPFHKDEQQHKHLQNDRRVQSTYYTLKYNSDTGNTGLKVTELPI